MNDIDEWIKSVVCMDVYIHTYTSIFIYTNMHMYSGILFSNKKNNAICSNMDGPRDYHISEVNQRKKDN